MPQSKNENGAISEFVIEVVANARKIKSACRGSVGTANSGTDARMIKNQRNRTFKILVER
jgi:orotidine-5'-phosphate decarboxylase